MTKEQEVMHALGIHTWIFPWYTAKGWIMGKEEEEGHYTFKICRHCGKAVYDTGKAIDSYITLNHAKVAFEELKAKRII